MNSFNPKTVIEKGILLFGLLFIWVSPISAQAESRSWTFEDIIDVLAWSPDAAQLAFSAEGSLQILDVTTGEIRSIFTYDLNSMHPPSDILWSPDQRLVVIEGYSGAPGGRIEGPYAMAVDVADGHVAWTHATDIGPWSLAFNPDNRTVAMLFSQSICSSCTTTVTIMDIAAGESHDLFGRDYFDDQPSPNDLTWSPDGSRLAVTIGGSVEVWDVVSRNPVTSFIAQSESQTLVSWNSEGDRLITLDDRIGIWNANSGQRIAVFAAPVSNEDFNFKNRVYWDNDTLLVMSGGKAMALDAISGQPLYTLTPALELDEPCSGRCTFWSPDGTFVAQREENRLTVSTPLQLRAPTPPTYQISIESVANDLDPTVAQGMVSWSPSGEILFTSTDTIANLSRPDEPARRISITGESIDTRLFSDDGSQVALALSDPDSLTYLLQLWDVSSGEKLHEMVGHIGSISALAFSPDGSLLASGSDDTTIRIWSTTTGEQLTLLQGHTGAITDIAFNPDGTLLASVSRDGTMWVWEVSSGQTVGIDDAYTEYVGEHHTTRVAFSPDGTKVIYHDVPRNDMMYGTPTVIWDMATSRHDFPLADFDPVFSPNGRYVAQLSLYGLNGLFDTHSSEEIHIINMACSGFTDGLEFDDNTYATWAAFSPDSTLLATAVWDECAPGPVEDIDETAFEWNTIWLVDLPDGTVLHILRGNTTPPYRLSFSPDGSQLLSQNIDGRIRLWDVETGELLQEWPEP